MDGAGVIFIEIPRNKSRSVSPVDRSEIKNTGFFDMLSRRFGRRSNDELYFTNGDEDTRSSSTESCSSTSVQFADRNDKKMNNNQPCKQHMTPNCRACNFGSNRTGLNSASDSSIDSMIDNIMNTNTAISANTTATTNGLHVHRRSTSSLRRLLVQNLSILSRSQSCSSTATEQKTTAEVKKSTKKSQSILRAPTSYTYLKGPSGLPQRVEIGRGGPVCCHYSMHQ